MRKLSLIAALAVAVVALPSVAKAADLPSGCVAVDPGVLECSVPASGLGSVDTRVRVILPEGYGDAPVPVVYLLHGVGDTYKTWVANTDVETFAPGLGALIVMPDGGKTPEAGWYSDWKDGSRRYEAFHTSVLIDWVESQFLTLTGRDHRAVAGLSMGGFGALSYAGRHPDLFSAAASFSGLLDTQMGGPIDGVGYAAGHSQLGTPDSRTWGDSVTEADEWSAHNPTALARSGNYDALDGNLWVAYGSGTPGGPVGDNPANPGGYGVEHYIWQTNQRFKLAMTQSGTDYHDLSYLGGLHDWPYWQHALHLILPQVVSSIS